MSGIPVSDQPTKRASQTPKQLPKQLPKKAKNLQVFDIRKI